MTILVNTKRLLEGLRFDRKRKYKGWGYRGHVHRESTNYVAYMINIYNHALDLKFETMVMKKKTECIGDVIEEESMRFIDLVLEFNNER